MSDNITKARDFLKSYLERNNTHLGEHSAVLALAEYGDQFGIDDTETRKLNDKIRDLEDQATGDLEKIAELEKKVADLTVERSELTKRLVTEGTSKPTTIPTVTTLDATAPKVEEPKQPVSGSK
jgi:hypothetical protein